MNGGDGEEADAGGSAAARPGLPDGTVTFVFTDVVGSTELCEQAPGVMREAMVLHDQLVEVAVEENSGMLVRPRGEGATAALPSFGGHLTQWPPPPR